eukprot:scaffold347_cov239-Pinguiococcus_pyrenoidosus.AAC.14
MPHSFLGKAARLSPRVFVTGIREVPLFLTRRVIAFLLRPVILRRHQTQRVRRLAEAVPLHELPRGTPRPRIGSLIVGGVRLPSPPRPRHHEPIPPLLSLFRLLLAAYSPLDLHRELRLEEVLHHAHEKQRSAAGLELPADFSLVEPLQRGTKPFVQFSRAFESRRLSQLGIRLALPFRHERGEGLLLPQRLEQSRLDLVEEILPLRQGRLLGVDPLLEALDLLLLLDHHLHEREVPVLQVGGFRQENEIVGVLLDVDALLFEERLVRLVLLDHGFQLFHLRAQVGHANLLGVDPLRQPLSPPLRFVRIRLRLPRAAFHLPHVALEVALLLGRRSFLQGVAARGKGRKGWFPVSFLPPRSSRHAPSAFLLPFGLKPLLDTLVWGKVHHAAISSGGTNAFKYRALPPKLGGPEQEALVVDPRSPSCPFPPPLLPPSSGSPL